MRPVHRCSVLLQVGVVALSSLILCPGAMAQAAGAADPPPRRIGGTVGKILDGLGRLGGTPAKGQPQGRVQGNGTSAHAQLQVIGTPTVSGGDTALIARLHADTGTVRIAPSGPCGASRVCSPGWDLRVVSVTLPASEIGAHSFVPITVEVENRGRTASPVSEVQLCAGDPGRPCTAKLDLVPLPSLASGERLRVVRRTTSTDATGPLEVQAIIDPDHATAEANRSNNTGSSIPFAVLEPALEFVAIDPQPESTAEGYETVTFAVRNPSTYVPSAPTKLLFQGPFTGRNNGALYTMDFPALAPRQILRTTVRVLIADANGNTGAVYGKGYFSMILDPTREWNRGWIQGDVAYHAVDARPTR